MLKNELAQRRLPAFDQILPSFSVQNWPQTQKAIGEFFQAKEFGFFPVKAQQISAALRSRVIEPALTIERYDFKCQVDAMPHSVEFPFECVLPNIPAPLPVVVWLDFGDNQNLTDAVPAYFAAQGFAVIGFKYSAGTQDIDDGYTSGVAQARMQGDLPEKLKAGKLAMWAWACSRLLDWAKADRRFDMNQTAVMGHSRLGKAALLAGLLDRRFQAVIANDSGCCGAALFRGSAGETVEHITTYFPYWFNQAFLKTKKVPADFDQHLLLAGMAPRLLYLSCAAGDTSSDYRSEYLAGLAASQIYAAMGLQGLPESRLPEIDDKLQTGQIGFHLRAGGHGFEQTDWQAITEFLHQHFDR